MSKDHSRISLASPSPHWRQRYRSFLLVFILSLFLGLLSPGARAQNVSHVFEDFEDKQAQGWELDEGWRIISGNAPGLATYLTSRTALLGEQHTFTRYVSQLWSGEKLQVSLAVVGLRGGVHLNLCQADEARYLFGLRYDDLKATLVDGYCLKQVGPADYQEIANFAVKGYEPGASLSIRARVSEGHLQLWANDQLVMDWQDPQPLPGGIVSLENLDDSQVMLDDISIQGQPYVEEALPDLVIASAQSLWDEERTGLSVEIRVDNRSDGPAPESLAQAVLVDGDWASDTQAIPELGPGRSATIVIWLPIADTHRGQTLQLLVTIDPKDVVREANERNNAQAIKVVVPVPEADDEPTQPPPPTRVEVIPTAEPVPTKNLSPLPPARIPSGALLLVGGLLLAWLIYRAARSRRHREARPKEQPRLAAAPVLLDAWYSEGVTEGGRRIPDHEPLRVGQVYTLHVAASPSARPNPGLGGQVIVYSPPGNLDIVADLGAMRQERDGAAMVTAVVRPHRIGRARLRVCLYDGNILSQSAMLDAQVIDVTEPMSLSSDQVQRREMDYVAQFGPNSTRSQPQPDLSLWTNHTVDGTHWLGIHAATDVPGFPDIHPVLLTYDRSDLIARAREVRARWERTQGTLSYRFSAQPPLSAREVEGRAADMVELALAGWRLFHHLFVAWWPDEEEDVYTLFRQALDHPSLISISRCRPGEATMPWAALYCLALDSSQPEALHICPIWLDHLAQATVDDEPLACGHKEDCPLQGENSRLTVCPWGFWGMLHQIEQPLQHIRPQPLGQTPDELASPSWGLESRLISDPRQKVRILGAVNASLPELPSHRRALQELAASGDVVFVWEETARDVVRQLHRGGFHLDYFYCHGETVDTVFRLKLGTDAQPSLLAADLLDPTDISWRDPPQPLILLNGCATMSQDPSIINDFMQTLRKLGALGVVGTEIPIADPLARFMALRLIDDLLNGRSLGEALLHARQRLAQELNPLGLIYTIYGPTTLHLHRTDHCEWCDAHRF